MSLSGFQMGRGKRYKPEQVVQILRSVEAAVANGIAAGQACSEAGIVEETYYRWRNEFGDLTVDQMKRLKELEQENAKLRRLVADLSLEKLLLKDIISGNL
jgi:putative transposase